MTAIRRVVQVVTGQAASDGAGVRLTRVIGGPSLPDLDPFLLLDEFGTDRPEDYIAGFPDHPHRGFETVTYMLDGRMRHRDNHGNEGVLVPGAVQWMTAGRGIIHSEMPEQEQGRMRGFQLWVNLPAREKMTAPRYQEFGPDRIPVVQPVPGASVKVIAGALAGVQGVIRQPATDPIYLDVALAAGSRLDLPVPDGHNAFVYVFEGALTIADDSDQGGGGRSLSAGHLARLDRHGHLSLRAEAGAGRAIVVAGRPLDEPIARHGPFVMNSREQLMAAFEDFRAGRF